MFGSPNHHVASLLIVVKIHFTAFCWGSSTSWERVDVCSVIAIVNLTTSCVASDMSHAWEHRHLAFEKTTLCLIICWPCAVQLQSNSDIRGQEFARFIAQLSLGDQAAWDFCEHIKLQHSFCQVDAMPRRKPSMPTCNWM